MSEGDAAYPPITGRGRPEFLPREMKGSKGQTIRPYGGLTGEEWMNAEPKPSEIPDQRTKPIPEGAIASARLLAAQEGCSFHAALDSVLNSIESITRRNGNRVEGSTFNV